jgi:hypothetical protein
VGNPFKKQAESSNFGKKKNMDIPVMNSVGENKRGGIYESTNVMQHKKQAADSGRGNMAMGMKRGGKINVMSAASNTKDAFKKGGRVGYDGEEAERKEVYRSPKEKIRQMVGPSYGLKNYPLAGHGSKSGAGRLEKNHLGPPPFKAIGGPGDMKPKGPK